MRAMRIAFSTASAPPLVKNTLFMFSATKPVMSWAASPRAAFACCGAMVESVAAWSWIALMTFGCWWPMFTLTSCDEKSRNLLPS